MERTLRVIVSGGRRAMKVLSRFHAVLARRVNNEDLPVFERLAAGRMSLAVFHAHGVLFNVLYAVQDCQMRRLQAKSARR